MRLRKLIVHGFKSFADRTEFVFDQPVTCIVGPNGCGKSNVVDAVKWVLGEQSAKSLRGDAMMDVIFNGSASRKPGGMAEVTLVFENPQKPDGSRVLNLPADEVAVGRRLYRDGTSEYTTNGHSSRLKDVRDLFLDTGVGVDAYSVIEQGRVARLLESNPQERRLIFEEAAGISRYKVKKKEAQRKLDKVDQNLLRVNDIVEEVEKRLRSVKVQAGRARTYQEHSTRLAELRLSFALQEYHVLHHALEALQAERDDTQFKLDDTAGDLQRRQNELADAREAAERVAQQKQQTEYDRSAADSAINSAKQRQQYAKQQREQLDEQTEQLTRDRDRAVQRGEEIGAHLEAESAAFAELTARLDAERKNIDEKQAAFRDGQLRLNTLAKQADAAKQAVLDLMRKLAGVGNRVSSLEIEKKNAAHHQQRQAGRRRQVATDAETLDAQAAELKTKLDAAVALIAERQHETEARKLAAADLSKQIRDVTSELNSAREHRSGLLSRQKLLQDLEARREGVSEGVKSVLKHRDGKYNFVRGLVADVMCVDVEHAKAIEAALDGRDQWLVVDTLDSVVSAGETFKELSGRVNFITREETGTSRGVELVDWNAHHASIRFARDLVRFDDIDAAVVQNLIGNTIVVDSLAEAQRLHAIASARYVTTAGEVLESNGVLRVGPMTAAMGLISRRSELDALRQQVAEVDARIAKLADQVAHSNAAAKALDEELNELRNAVYQANAVRVEISTRQQQTSDRIAALRRELPLLDRELQNLSDQADRIEREQQTLEQQRTQHESQQAEQQRLVEDSTANHAQIAEELKATNEAMTVARVALGQVQEKQLASRQSVERLTAQQAETQQQAERLRLNLAAMTGRANQIENEISQAVTAAEEATERRDALARQAVDLADRLAKVQGDVKQFFAHVETLRAGHARFEQEAHRLALKLSEQNVRRETLVARTLEELQLDLPARFEELSQAEGGYTPEALDWSAISTEIKELREKIQRLGNVNLDAIGELDELETREKFYAEQLRDLADSKKQLEGLIDEINRESSIRFEQTFNAVREHFQGMFRQLFGGGKADLFLETEVEEKSAVGGRRSAGAEKSGDESVVENSGPIMRKIDPLDAGIEIIARPPGKQPVSISQLSGGEKTMTCIALLMSIFKSKPSPFCILDEVDAALDEANNVRFGLIVQEFLATSQFVVITHHKRTMQIADVLYGVTMQEQGVSKRVAVKFDQVGTNGRISDAAVKEAEAAELIEAN